MKAMPADENNGSSRMDEPDDSCIPEFRALLLVKNRCGGLRAPIRSYKDTASKTVWKVRPQKVIVLYAKAGVLRYVRRTRVARSSWNSV